MKKRARIVQDLVAQLAEELDLRRGGELVVLGETEDGWYRGEFEGRTGIFPPAFVTILGDVPGDGDSPLLLDEPLALDIKASKSSNEHDNNNSPTTTKNDHQPTEEISRPSSPYGIASYDYQARYADELTLTEGQVVYLVKHVNSEWSQGKTSRGPDSRVAIFPTSFIQIVIDCDAPVPVSSPQHSDNITTAASLLEESEFMPSASSAAGFGSLNSEDQLPYIAEAYREAAEENKIRSTPKMSRADFCRQPASSCGLDKIDNIIERNLNELSSAKSIQFGSVNKKPVSVSWSAIVAQPTPLVPEQTKPSLCETRTTTDLYSSGDLFDIRPVETSQLVVGQRRAAGGAIQVDEYDAVERQHLQQDKTTTDLVQIESEAGCTSYDSGDSSAERRSSFNRPARPPPPVPASSSANDSQWEMNRRNSTDSLASNAARSVPVRPAPLVPGTNEWHSLVD